MYRSLDDTHRLTVIPNHVRSFGIHIDLKAKCSKQDYTVRTRPCFQGVELGAVHPTDAKSLGWLLVQLCVGLYMHRSLGAEVDMFYIDMRIMGAGSM